MRTFMEGHQIVMATVPVDGQTADNTGDYVGLQNYREVVWVGIFAIGTAGDDPVIDANQAKDAAGGSVKGLNFTAIWHKVGATAISAIGQFTKIAQTAAASYDSVGIDGAENEMLLVLRFTATELDHANGFEYVRVDIADVGANAQLVSALYILGQPRNRQTAMTGAIA